MIIDGNAIAKEILARTKARADALPQSPRVVAVVVNETPATLSYLKIKESRAEEAGCLFSVARKDGLFTAPSLVTEVQNTPGDALIIQLPLPPALNTQFVCDAIPLAKDADVLSSAARDKFERGDALALLPPVVGAVRQILAVGSVDPKGKKAVVIGAGFLVGAPVAVWLTQQGAEVMVITLESGTENLSTALATADIIVSGAGSPKLITPEIIKEGVVLIDAGTAESDGTIVGDADPACAAKCAIFTPVPGGVGPISVACLFENAVLLAESKPFIS